MKIAFKETMGPDKSYLGAPCIICDESVPLTQNEILSLEHGHHIHSKVCDKCKAAVLRMREQMKQEEKEFDKALDCLLKPCSRWR